MTDQPIAVNITFNISTGVQQTVRAELEAMMPSIEKRTTDAVRAAITRGGSLSKKLLTATEIQKLEGEE